jgi:dCMP deaminase
VVKYQKQLQEKRMDTEWDKKNLGFARVISANSLDPSTKCGAVITSTDRKVLSWGWNKFPNYIANSPENWNNREFKYRHVIHAEKDAAMNLPKNLGEIELDAIYVWPFMSCIDCAQVIQISKIRRVVIPLEKDPEREERWKDSLKASREFCEIHKITIEEISIGV